MESINHLVGRVMRTKVQEGHQFHQGLWWSKIPNRYEKGFEDLIDQVKGVAKCEGLSSPTASKLVSLTKQQAIYYR